MKTQLNHQSNCSGGSLAVVLVTGGFIGLTLASFITLVNYHNKATARSQTWNNCMAVVEAGIEEALTHSAYNYRTNMVSSGWTVTNSSYGKTAAVLSGAAQGGGGVAYPNGYYTVTISTNLPYTILATGYYPIPATSKYLARTVRVTTTNQGVFSGAMFVRSYIDMNGNNVKTDSYDSTNPNKSTLGKYDPLKAGDHGDVSTTTGLTNSVNVGNANVWGHVYTGPSGGVKYGANGAVGDVAWQTAGNSGIEAGWWRNDFNVTVPDVTPPFTNAPAPLGGSVLGVGYDYILGNGNYQLSSFGKNALVTGNAVLYVTGDIKFTGSDSITINPGGSLTIYAAGANAQFNVINSSNPSATSFIYYGLPSNTSLVLKGQNFLLGCVYAPEADFVMTGGGDVYGSLVANSARFTGNSAFHYDESLINVGLSRGFLITSWNEQ